MSGLNDEYKFWNFRTLTNSQSYINLQCKQIQEKFFGKNCDCPYQLDGVNIDIEQKEKNPFFMKYFP